MAERTDLLDSWKEISDYLKREVRTCQRYERELGLPVHRLDGSSKARVFAHKHEIDAWRAKTVDEREQKRKRSRRAILAVTAVVGTSAAVLILWRPWAQRKDIFVLPSDRPSVAILNLANRTGQKDLDPFREVLPYMISDDLSQSRYIYVVPPEQVNGALAQRGFRGMDAWTAKDMKSIGRELGARYLATGFFSKAGERLLVRIGIREFGSGRTIGTVEAQGVGLASLFELTDRITAEIKPHLEMTVLEVANDIDGRMERVTTSSIEAYRHYLNGRKMFFGMKTHAAIEMFEKALEIDPNFAMAYRALAQCYNNTDPAKYIGYLDKALSLSERAERLPLREKLLIRGQSATLGPEDRFKALTELLRLYPDDRIANMTIANHYAEAGELAKAAERYEAIILRKPPTIAPYSNLVMIHAAQGEYRKAHRVLAGAFRDFSGKSDVRSWIHRALGYLYENEGRWRRAWRQNQKAERLQPGMPEVYAAARIRIHLLSGRLTKAEAGIRELVSKSENMGQSEGKYYLSRLHLIRGRFQEAIPELRRLEEEASDQGNPIEAAARLTRLVATYIALNDLTEAERQIAERWKTIQNASGWEAVLRKPWESQIAYWESVILQKRGAIEEARRAAEDLAARFENELDERSMRYVLLLRGRLELEMGNCREAIELLARAKALEPHMDWYRVFPSLRVMITDLLASAYDKVGDLEGAGREYEAITHMALPRLSFGDIYARSFYKLGQIYERLGKKKPARANYRKFLELWNDADPGLPEVEDAKKRLASLR